MPGEDAPWQPYVPQSSSQSDPELAAKLKELNDRVNAELRAQIEREVRAKVAEEIEQTFGPFRDRYDLDEGDLAMAHSITWHLKGLCDNCGRTVDDLPCGVAHGFRLTGRMLDQDEVRARRKAAAIARGGRA